MENSKTIKNIKDLSTEELTDILYEKNAMDQGKVISISRMPCNQIATSGTLFRLNIKYDLMGNGPESMIMKLPAINPNDRKFHIEKGYYYREVLFYRELSQYVEGMVPLCYHAAWDHEDDTFHILMEDSRKGRNHTLMGAGPSIQQTYRIIEWLAKFHAYWWQHPKLKLWEKELSPLQDMKDIEEQSFGEGGVLDLIGDWCTDEEIDLCRETVKMLPEIQNQQQQSPYTLCHGDFHPLNIFIPLEVDTKDLQVIDWQFCHVGTGVSDLANFLGIFLHPQFRREHQEKLISHYYESLIKYGVENYTYQQCIEDYKIQLRKNLLMPFFQKNIPNLSLDAMINCFRNGVNTYYDNGRDLR